MKRWILLQVDEWIKEEEEGEVLYFQEHLASVSSQQQRVLILPGISFGKSELQSLHELRFLNS